MELDRDFREFIGLLNDHKVDYLVVGGYSVAHHGFPRYTGDIDIWIKPIFSNGQKMINVIEEFGFGSLGLTPKDFTLTDMVVQFGVEPLRIDILTAVSGLSSFDLAFTHRDEAKYNDLNINFIGYHDLIKNKVITNRLQDQRDVEELKKIKK
jgi:hypothetical protein